jgi:CheY-like chemotaxis protein
MPIPVVLVVDENQEARLEIAEAALAAGYVVACAPGTAETLEFLRAGIRWDAVVFDVRGSSGALTRYLDNEQASAQAPIVAIGAGDRVPRQRMPAGARLFWCVHLGRLPGVLQHAMAER